MRHTIVTCGMRRMIVTRDAGHEPLHDGPEQSVRLRVERAWSVRHRICRLRLARQPAGVLQTLHPVCGCAQERAGADGKWGWGSSV